MKFGGYHVKPRLQFTDLTDDRLDRWPTWPMTDVTDEKRIPVYNAPNWPMTDGTSGPINVRVAMTVQLWEPKRMVKNHDDAVRQCAKKCFIRVAMTKGHRLDRRDRWNSNWIELQFIGQVAHRSSRSSVKSVHCARSRRPSRPSVKSVIGQVGAL